MEMTRGEMQDLLAKFSTENPDYRKALIEKPKEVVAAQFKIDVPDNVEVQILEESATKIYVVLPHAVAAGDELSDDDLEAVAGGGTFVKEANCEEGTLSTVINVEASLF